MQRTKTLKKTKTFRKKMLKTKAVTRTRILRRKARKVKKKEKERKNKRNGNNSSREKSKIYVLGESMIKKLNGYFLTKNMRHKYLIKVQIVLRRKG